MQNTSSLRAMSYTVKHATPTTGTSFITFFWSIDLKNTALIFDPRPEQRGTVLRNYRPLKGYEPNRIEPNGIVANWIVDDYENVPFTEDGQFTELEDLRVKSLSYHCRLQLQPMTQRKASRRHPKRTLMTNNFELCWLHHCTCRSEEHVQNGSQVYHSERENLMSSSSQDPRLGGTRKPDAVLSSQSKWNQDTFSDRRSIFLETSTGFWEVVNQLFRFSNPANLARSLLDGNRDHLLTEARSELITQEYKVESLNTCINELQQQTYAQRLGLEDASGGCVESRREHVRLQEELVIQEKAFRDTQIRSMHDLGEMKRAQELRVDEILCDKTERKS